MEVRLLHIEDNPQDAWLIHRVLREDGWKVEAQVVSSLSEFLSHLESPCDVVLADFGLPGMSTTEALRMVRQSHPEMPFVVVSGQIGEENAVALMKAGADDYVSKDYPGRLSPILKRLLEACQLAAAQRVKDLQHQELENQFQLFFQGNLSGMAIVTPEGTVCEINKALLDLLGLDPRSLPSVWSLLASASQSDAIREQRASGRSFGPKVIEMIRLDGKSVFLLSTFQVPDQHARIWANFIDHTEQQQLQKQMYQFGKWESLGEIAGGVAHEINNILAVFLGQLSLMELETLPGERPSRRVDLLKRTTQRGSAIVKQLLTLARQQPSRQDAFPVKALLEETLQLVKGVFPAAFDFCIEAPADLPSLKGDRDQLVQALLNLAINARDAMPEGGIIGFGARVADPEGLVVRLEVTDEGAGVSPDLVEKIFTPFFTTKAAGKGTGLGLFLVASIAQSHQGSAGVEPRIPRGCTFFLLLPASSDSTPKEALDRGALDSQSLPPEERGILLVENEEDLSELEAEILTLQGFVVTRCATAEEAVVLLRTGLGKISLVVTDLGLAGMGGEALCRLILALPVPPAVVVQSGNLAPDVRERLEALGVSAFLVKPFLIEDLSNTLRDVLAGGGVE